MNSIRIDTELLHPYLGYLLNQFIKKCNEQNIPLIITEGLRTVQRQDELYAQGRTTKGTIVTNARGRDYQSQHQWGIAFDIAINEKGKTYDVATLRKCGEIAHSIKHLAWGGDWTSPVDMPHFYLDKWGATTKELKNKYGTPDKFMKTWVKTVKRKKGLNLWNKQKWNTKKTSDDKVRAKIPYGDQVRVCYTKSIGWSFVEYKGTYGWVMTKHLK